jgi:hypothetical protein
LIHLWKQCCSEDTDDRDDDHELDEGEGTTSTRERERERESFEDILYDGYDEDIYRGIFREINREYTFAIFFP